MKKIAVLILSASLSFNVMAMKMPYFLDITKKYEAGLWLLGTTVMGLATWKLCDVIAAANRGDYHPDYTRCSSTFQKKDDLVGHNLVIMGAAGIGTVASVSALSYCLIRSLICLTN